MFLYTALQCRERHISSLGSQSYKWLLSVQFLGSSKPWRNGLQSRVEILSYRTQKSFFMGDSLVVSSPHCGSKSSGSGAPFLQLPVNFTTDLSTIDKSLTSDLSPQVLSQLTVPVLSNSQLSIEPIQTPAKRATSWFAYPEKFGLNF